MPLASTRSRPSSAPVAGRGNSRSSIWPGATWTAARTMSVIALYLSTGTAVPDQPPNNRTTIEMPAFRAPATAIVVARVLADAGQIFGGPAGPVSEKSPDRDAIETSAGQQLGMLGAEDD